LKRGTQKEKEGQWSIPWKETQARKGVPNVGKKKKKQGWRGGGGEGARKVPAGNTQQAKRRAGRKRGGEPPKGKTTQGHGAATTNDFAKRNKSRSIKRYQYGRLTEGGFGKKTMGSRKTGGV